MLQALAMPAATPEQVAARQAAIAAARAQELEATRGMPVTERLMSRVDTILGLPAMDPTLAPPRRDPRR